MLGVVLCGGQSSRMGSDKCVLPIGEITWADVAINTIQSLELPVVLSVNKHQYNIYKSVFTEAMIVDDENLKIGGPLRGILSIYIKYPTEDLLVIACDMINVSSVLITTLINSLNNTYDGVVYKNDDRVEPLCALYTAQGLRKILHLHQQKLLKRHSMHYALDQLSILYIEAPREWQPFFTNYNSPADLS